MKLHSRPVVAMAALGAALLVVVLAISPASARTAPTSSEPFVDPPGLAVQDMNHGTTAQDLANSLVGGGVTVSNVTFTGTNNSAGSFSGGNGIIGFDDGIVMGSGSVQSTASSTVCSKGVEGPNTCDSNTTANGSPGDADLTALSGVPTFDASVLQFDFVPQFPTLQFSYVFSSDEYNEFANSSFNDTFAFFVNGTNCALVPGTTLPVSVDTINGGNPFGTNPQHAEFYRNNSIDDPGPATINTEMDGLTTVLDCNATVNPGVTNHMKLAIADGSDQILDSNVFIEGGSLVSGTVISTTLSGGNQSGSQITVPNGTAVKDSATLSGVHAPTASGTVTYTAYSNAACTTVAGSGGTKTVTGGVVPDSNSLSLAPGTYFWQAAYSGDALNNASTTTCGDEKLTVQGGSDITPPSCTLTGVVNGPPKAIKITVADTGSGLKTIVATKSTNANTVVPAFASGATSPVVVTSTKLDQTKSSTVALKVTDVAGNVTTCDPTLVTISGSVHKKFTHMSGSEPLVTIHNGTPGLKRIVVVVNGVKFSAALKSGATKTINIGSALKNGRHNVVKISGSGRGTADVLIWDGQ